MEGLRTAQSKFATPGDLESHFVTNSVAQLVETATRELERNREMAKASLVAASTILQSEIERHSGARQARRAGLVDWQIARVRAFIEKNLHGAVRNADLSKLIRRSPAYFSRSFKLTFGEPPHVYVIRRRLEKARQLMLTSSASLSEIALSAGFADQAHLCRQFRKAFRQSPACWRRERETLQIDSDAGTTCTGA
jgi:AraC family transcriptional regulator